MTTSALHPDTEVKADDPDEPSSPFLVRVIASLPLFVPVMVTALALAAVACLLLEIYALKTVLPLGIVLALLGLRVVGLGERHVSRKQLTVDVLALLLALGFAGFNATYSSQNVTVARDPGVYTVASQWLVNHDNLNIDGQPDLFGPQKVLSIRSMGIGPVTEYGHLYAQGTHVVPSFLGVSGRLFGTTVMYKTNALIGGLALLAVYGFARRLIGRWGALAAAGLLGVGLPQIAFSRDNYTEPLSQLFVYGGLALLWHARRGAWGQWALAGMVVAGSCMARIDAFLILPALAAYAGLCLASAAKGERKLVLRDVTALAIGVAIPAVLGIADLRILAPGYYRTLSDELVKMLVALVAALVVAAVLVALSWSGGDRRWQDLRPRVAPVLGNIAAAVVVLIGLAFASRPLWWTVEGDNHPGTTAFIGNMQAAEGMPREPNRLYTEHSVTWLGWYLGPLCTALALFGMALLVRRAFRDRDLRLVPFLAAFAGTAGLYLFKPNIVPDHIWVMRRFVPVVLPGVAICGVLVVCLLLAKLAASWRPYVAAATGLALFVPVLYISEPFLTVRERVPQVREIDRVCSTVPDDAGVIVVGLLSRIYPMTVRTFCGVPTAAIDTLTPEVAKIASTSLAASGRRLYVVSADDVLEKVPYSKQAGFPQPVSKIETRVWAETLTTPPRGTNRHPRQIFVGEVGPEGKVVAWQPLQS